MTLEKEPFEQVASSLTAGEGKFSPIVTSFEKKLKVLPYRADLIQNSQRSVTWNKDSHARKLTLQCSLDVINAVFLFNEMKVTQASSFQLPWTAVFFVAVCWWIHWTRITIDRMWRSAYSKHHLRTNWRMVKKGKPEKRLKFDISLSEKWSERLFRRHFFFV